MKTFLIALTAGALLCGCQTTKVTHEYTDFPIRPDLRELTKPPIVSYDKDKEEYVVTQEYVERSTQLEKYNEKVDSWKAQNNL